MAKKAKKTEKKEKLIPLTLNDRLEDRSGITVPSRAVLGIPKAPEFETPDNEDMTDAETTEIFDDQEKRKKDLQNKLEIEVDTQEWTLADPIIHEDLAGKVWVAVYRCPDGHKTKATNRQAKSGVWCWKHREAGQKVMATIMPQFLNRPDLGDPDVAKRKKAAKGAQ